MALLFVTHPEMPTCTQIAYFVRKIVISKFVRRTEGIVRKKTDLIIYLVIALVIVNICITCEIDVRALSFLDSQISRISRRVLNAEK